MTRRSMVELRRVRSSESMAARSWPSPAGGRNTGSIRES